MKRFDRLAWAVLGLLMCASSTFAAPPAAPKHPVVDRYWGTSVTDEYRWLENAADVPVQRWTTAQDSITQAFLDSLPDRPAILRRVEELSKSLTPSWSGLTRRGNAYFALKNQPPRQQPFLVRLASVDDTSSAKALLDPVKLDPSGNTTIDFFTPSLDGSRIAVSLSKGGSESGDLVVIDGTTGARLADRIPRVHGGTAGGSVAWNADGTGFWYTRYPSPGERPEAELDFWQQLWFHRMGTPLTQDRPVLTASMPKIAEIALTSSADGRSVLADVSNGDGGEHALWLGGDRREFLRVSNFQDHVLSGAFVDDALVLLSLKGAPMGQLLRLPLATPTLAKAALLVPENPKAAIRSVTATRTRIYVLDQVGGPAQIRIYDHAGMELGTVPLPPVSSVSRMLRDGDDGLLVQHESYTEPDRWSHFDAAKRALVATALAQRSPADFSNIEVRREFVTSKDGTRVPLNLLMKKGTRVDGSAPALLYGYGGYGLSQNPNFQAARQVWLEQGGIYAVANLRGGAEYGDAWHLAGNLTNKQHVFDDMAACAEFLVKQRYTSVDHLALNGGGNGGLLMGAMLTQIPDKFRAVVSSVGIYDMLRVELSPNGAFNVTEFGTVKDSAQFRALYNYSPYHHVKPGTPYPAVMFTTGANDPRVDPMHSRKMTASLQAATTSGRPVLLRARTGVGHGGGSPLSIRNQQSADLFSFLLSQLGVKYRPVVAPVP